MMQSDFINSFNPDIFTPVINGYLPEPQSSLFNGILFGVELNKKTLFYQQLREVGLLHLVVLSGMNISLLAAIVGVMLAPIGRIVSSLITILIIIIFVVFVGPQAPIIRAAIMGVLTLGAIIYGRKTATLYLLFLSGVFMLIFWPEWLTSISFQLSYGATLGIILFAGHDNKRTSGPLQAALSDTKKELRLSLSAQIFTTPIIFFYFKQISFISPLANVLVAFLIGPLMIFGFLTAFLGKIHFLLGLPFSMISYGLLTYMVMVVEVLSQVPFAFISL